MTWRAIGQRGRHVVAWGRAQIRLRVLVRAAAVLNLLLVLTVSGEAVIRARLAAPLERMQSALYTRPTAWSGAASPRRPVVLGSLDGSPIERRIPLDIAELPRHLVDAVLAIEDKRFYQHHGLDLVRIGGALLANLRARGIAQGGSTITQQLAKNLFLGAQRTPLRKLREAALAVVLELRYDKSTILEAYLNEIYLGQDGARPIHGVGGAAGYYFGQDARRLGVAESALLAGMISAPNRYAPTHNPEAARRRRDLVLQLMRVQGRIGPEVAERAARGRVASREHPSLALDGRYFRDYALASLPARAPARGLAVYTSLDATLQRAAERAVQAGLDRLPARGAQAALVALDPQSGEVLALVGGRDYAVSQFNRATEAHRQPGSAFKPVVALAALEPNGGRPAFTLASMVNDEPLAVRTAGGLWQPSNYDGRFRGPVTLREAMEQSLNVPFARIGLELGPGRIAETARRLGITSPLAAVPSLALGSSEVTLLELARAYGVLAAGGDLAASRSVTGWSQAGGAVEPSRPVERRRVIDPAVAYLVTSMLEGVVTRGTGRALNQEGRFAEIAGKTGTSNDWRDAWFVAYSPSLVVGVWVGFDDGRSLHLSGAAAALPIAARFLAEVGSGERGSGFEVPEGITEQYVGRTDGGWFAECGSREIFLEGTQPSDAGCGGFELPRWELPRDWGRVLQRRAAQLLDALLSRERRAHH